MQNLLLAVHYCNIVMDNDCCHWITLKFRTVDDMIILSQVLGDNAILNCDGMQFDGWC